MCRLSITSKRPSLFYNNTYTSITFVTFNATTSSTTFANYNNTIACLAFVLMMVVNDNSNNSNNNNFNYISYCSNETHLPLELTSHTHTNNNRGDLVSLFILSSYQPTISKTFFKAFSVTFWPLTYWQRKIVKNK